MFAVVNPEKAKKLQHYAQAIAALLYEETPSEQLQTLEGIETAITEQVLQHVSPEIAVFLSAAALAQTLTATPGASSQLLCAWRHNACGRVECRWG